MPSGGVLNSQECPKLCPECSQTCAGTIVAVVVLVTDLFFPHPGVEAQQNGAQAARHSHRNDHPAS